MDGGGPSRPGGPALPSVPREGADEPRGPAPPINRLHQSRPKRSIPEDAEISNITIIELDK